MLRDDGTPRTDRQDRHLAAWLACVAGYVNAAAFVQLGTFTSHVTGQVGHFAEAAATGTPSDALVIVVPIGAFFVGAFASSLAAALLGRGRRLPVLLGAEALLLVAYVCATTTPWVVRASLLTAAMGLQNSLIPRLSDTVIRTTHLTGTVTDLGSDTAAWLLGDTTAPRRLRLLGTILAAFTLGGVGGAVAGRTFDATGLLLPAACLGVAAAFATR